MSWSREKEKNKQGYRTWPLLVYGLKFGAIFCIGYFGARAIFGLSSPGRYYSPFIAQHVNWVDSLRVLTLKAANWLVQGVHYKTHWVDSYHLKLMGGKGVYMAYGCIGIGVYSFWLAFILANSGSAAKKATWLIGGCCLLFAVNVSRIALVLVGSNRGWRFPFGWDHHTWFNIGAYLLIFAMMWAYGRQEKRKESTTRQETSQKHHNSAPAVQ